MRKVTIIFTLLSISILFSACYAWRGVRWYTADLEDVNLFDAVKIEKSTQAFEFKSGKAKESNNAYRLDTLLEGTNTVAFIVIRNDSILYESYWEGYQADSKIPSFSVAKSFVSTLVGIAVDEKKIKGTDESITNYIPELLELGTEYQKITIQDCLDMSSGLDNGENYDGINVFRQMVRMYYGTNLEKEVFKSKIKTARGEFNYQSINTQVLGMVVERATGKRLYEYLQEKIWQPLGMEHDASWSVDSKKRKTVKAFAALNAAPIDFAKLGRLFLNKGDWNGQQIISKEWVETTTNPDTLHKYHYKNQWWSSYLNRVYTDSLEAIQYKKENLQTTRMISRNGLHWFKDYGKIYQAEGILGQFIFVRPDKNLIIVRMGDYSKKRIKADKYERHWMNGFLGYVSKIY
ncbi:MAG: serine hydrolase domain-containing protein [Saprospiraceae bacterium]